MTPVVLMAGGFGLRLHPLTEKTPKPLLKVGGRPILEQVMEGYAADGFRRFFLCVHYKADLIREYFGDGSRWGWRVRYVEEPKPLGTAGAVALLPKFDVPFIVSNADILVKLSYGQLMESHARSNADATVCAALYQHQVPYGVIRHENGTLDKIDEKPIENFSVNAGVYVLEPRIRGLLPRGQFDMPDLLRRLDRVNVYPLENHWEDVGSFEALARANQEWS